MSSTTQKDQLLKEILGWGKSIAQIRKKDSFGVDEVLLGALHCDGGKELLRRILGAEKPLELNALCESQKNELEQLTLPVESTMKLDPDLRKITSAIWSTQGLDPEKLLKEIIRSVQEQEPWNSFIQAVSKQVSDTKPFVDRNGIIRSVFTELESLRVKLSSTIVGQDRAIDQVCDACFPILLRSKGDAPPSGETKGPKSIFTFVGPPGVGKTLLAETLAGHFSPDSGEALLRLDMSGYSTHQAHEQLVGFSKAYAGAQEGILSGFVSRNPEGFILIDELEKAHINTKNLFLQILDAGILHENNSKKTADFSKATLIFTTNLGSDLYDSPERAGVLEESKNLSSVILAALGKDGKEPLQGHGDEAALPPELISRLAKGTTVLFQRLDGMALELLAERTIQAVSTEFERAAGITINCASPEVLTLLILRFGSSGDARTLAANLRSYLYEVMSQALKEQSGSPLTSIETPCPETFSLCIKPDEPLPGLVQKRMQSPLRVLLIDDDRWDDQFSVTVNCSQVRCREEADTVLRTSGADCIMLDLHIGAPRGERCCDQGLALLRWLRSSYPQIPVYLFSENPDERGLSPEILERVRLDGGARGVFSKRIYEHDEERLLNEDSLYRQLQEVEARLRREGLVMAYRRKAAALDFDIDPLLEQSSPPKVSLQFCRIREITVVSAADRNSPGWVDLPKERFNDIVGLQQVKERLLEVVGWLNDPTPLRDMGIEPPRGILLTGPPGTGKTTLARAVAGEAQVPFFAISGSEVFSKWVGESEATIRKLFTTAQRYAPSVIFIDEIDSLGKSRSSDQSTGSDHSSGVLNELLTRMDGFAQEDRQVFVLAATNRPDVLDAALLRPGRFDIQVEVAPPGPEAREAMLRMALKEVPLEQGCDLKILARRISGMSGAEIRQVAKEAAMLAVRMKRKLVNMEHLQEAVTLVRMGLKAEGMLLSDEVRRATAVHEAGHAVAQWLNFPEEQVSLLSIAPRGRAMGFAEHTSTDEQQELTPPAIRRRMRVLLAGRAAEELVLGSEAISAGCSNDLARSSALAIQAISNWGMDDDHGLISLDGIRSGLGIVHGEQPPLSDEAVRVVRRWLTEEMTAVAEQLQIHRSVLDRIANTLIAEETLTSDDLSRLLTC